MTRRRSRPDTQSAGAAGPARPARQVRYTVIGDQLCAVRGTEYELVLGLAPQIDRLLYPASAIAADPGLLDPGRQWHGPSSTRPSHVRLRYLHPATGEQQHLTLTYRQAVSSSWLSLPPFVTLAYDSSRLRRVWEAIRLTSPEPQVSALYDSTGWHKLPEHGWGWIHARGAITATGHTPAFVHLTGPLAWFDLPDPLTGPSRLREQFQTHSMGLLDRLPERVGAARLGHIFRAALGPTPVSPLLVGAAGTYKTSLSCLAMHHYGERWDRLGRAAMWLNQDSGTPAAMRWLTYHAKDAVLFCDGAYASAPSQRSLALLIEGPTCGCYAATASRSPTPTSGRSSNPRCAPCATSCAVASRRPRRPGRATTPTGMRCGGPGAHGTARRPRPATAGRACYRSW